MLSVPELRQKPLHTTPSGHQTWYFRNHATSAAAEFGGKCTTSCEIEPVRRSFCRCRSCTFTEVARLVPSSSSLILTPRKDTATRYLNVEISGSAQVGA